MASYENAKALRKAVEKQTGPVSDEDWEMATLDLTPYTAYDHRDLEEVLEKLQGIGVEPQSRKYASLKGAWRKAQLEAEKRAKSKRFAVKEIREAVFGDPGPPFETMEEADDWILAEAKKQGEGKVVGSLQYGGRNGAQRRVEVRSGSLLETLLGMTQASFQIFPYNRPDSRWHRALASILTDEVIPVRLYEWIYLPGHEYTITIRSPDVSNEFIRELCQALREATWDVKAPSSRTPDQVERAFHLVGFMERTTLLSRSERLKEWNQKYPQWAFDYEGQMLEAYKRAVPPRDYEHWKYKASLDRKFRKDLRLERQRKST